MSTWDKQWPTGCVWTTWGPCSDQPVDRDLWDTPLRCCLAKQTPLPSPPLTQSAETLTGGPARNLYWQAATTNQSTERMPGSCMRTRERWDLLFQLPHPSHFQNWSLDFLGQCEHSRMGEAHGRRIAAVCSLQGRGQKGPFTCSNFQPSDMVDTICVSSSSWHCSTRYTCFTGTWGGGPTHERGITGKEKHQSALNRLPQCRRKASESNFTHLGCFAVTFPDLVLDELY